jgi:hypothetical protein
MLKNGLWVLWKHRDVADHVGKNVLVYKLLSLWYSVIATQNCPIHSLKLKIGNESINICLKVCEDHQQNSFIIES